MTTAIETTSLTPRPVAGNTPLWAAVGVLSAAVLAMGGTMLYRQGAQSVVTPVAALSAAPQQVAALKLAAPATTAAVADDLVESPAAPVKKVVIKPAPRPAPAPHYSHPAPQPYPARYANTRAVNHPAAESGQYAGSYPASYPRASACATCGSVESVTAVERASKPAPISVGSVAGGVIGAALGSQVGGGNGRTLATVIGALGGGYAGHVIEGQVRKDTVYQVGVRMEDGTRRVVEVGQAPSIGSRVTVDGNTISSNEGVAYRAPAPVMVRAPATSYGQPQAFYAGQ